MIFYILCIYQVFHLRYLYPNQAKAVCLFTSIRVEANQLAKLPNEYALPWCQIKTHFPIEAWYCPRNIVTPVHPYMITTPLRLRKAYKLKHVACILVRLILVKTLVICGHHIC